MAGGVEGPPIGTNMRVQETCHPDQARTKIVIPTEGFSPSGGICCVLPRTGPVFVPCRALKR